MLQIERVEDWLGRPVVGVDGEKIGRLEDLIFAPDSTPLLGAVSTGLFGRRVSLVPLADASLTPDHITVPYSKDAVKGAPQLDGPSEMSGEVEDATADHYGQPRRQRGEGEQYVSAEQRARHAEEIRQADERATQLEREADTLAAEVESARVSAQEAHERYAALAAQHADALQRAEDARHAHAAMST